MSLMPKKKKKKKKTKQKKKKKKTTGRFVSDVFGSHIVGFPMRRLKL